ncbi:MAG: hypothetical protein PVJ19_21310 [Desulfobacteraceae bacterium]|jgi:hypothetical protein
MKTLRIIPIVLFLFSIIIGCASHYYRTDDNGVILHLREPKTASVTLFTSADGFLPNAAERRGGTWVNRISSDGQFSYFYKVDGELYTPDCRFKEMDDFGLKNCIYVPGL